MKNVIYVYCLIAISFIFTACGYYPDVLNKNQYVHLFYLQNETSGDLVFMQETKSGMSGTGGPTKYYLITEVIINNKETLPKNILLSLSAGVNEKVKSVELAMSKHDEDGNLLFAKTYPITEEMDNSPYWNNNYILTPADLVDHEMISMYKKKVIEGHVKVYVLPVTEEYLEQLEARE